MKRIVVKVLIFAAIVMLTNAINDYLSLQNSALSISAQLADSNISLASYHSYRDFLGYDWLVVLVIAIAMFCGEIKKLIIWGKNK